MSVQVWNDSLRRAHAESAVLQLTCGALLAHLAALHSDPSRKLDELTGRLLGLSDAVARASQTSGDPLHMHRTQLASETLDRVAAFAEATLASIQQVR